MEMGYGIIMKCGIVSKCVCFVLCHIISKTFQESNQEQFQYVGLLYIIHVPIMQYHCNARLFKLFKSDAHDYSQNMSEVDCAIVYFVVYFIFVMKWRKPRY